MTAERSRTKALLRQGLPPAVTILILYLLYKSIDDPPALLAALGSADPKYLLAAVGLVLANNLLASAWQHQTLGRALGLPIGLAESSFLKLVTFPLRAVLLKASDLTRAVYYQRRFGMDLGLAAAATMLVPLVNLYVLVLAAFVGITISGDDPFHMKLPLLALIVIAPPAALLASRRLKGLSAGSGRLSALAGSLSRLAALPKGVTALVVSQGVLCLFLEVAILGMFLRSVNAAVPISTLLWVVPTVLVAANLPITLLGIGAREWVVVTLLSAFGPRETLLAAGLLSSSLDRLLLAVAGLPALRTFAKRIKGTGAGVTGQ